jgi:hypothetical protein
MVVLNGLGGENPWKQKYESQEVANSQALLSMVAPDVGELMRGMGWTDCSREKF